MKNGVYMLWFRSVHSTSLPTPFTALRQDNEFGSKMPRRPISKFERSIPDYRKRILVALSKALILPPVLTHFCFRAFNPSYNTLSLPLRCLVLTSSVFLFTILRSQYTLWQQDMDARRFGVKPIRRVEGRWPGNLDVVLRVMESFKTGYILQGFADLFEEYQCTTLNTRFFWDDQVGVVRIFHLR
jgi:hypothetical protein